MSRPTTRHDFLRDIIDADLASGRHQRVVTRFPPEPNGYLHIGHAKSICVNFGIARDYQGSCNLRYDDTNPIKEDVEYVESIERDVRWLGFSPSQVLFSADYFPKMYDLAEQLVRDGRAYVCDLDDEQIREYRGTLAEAGRPSPWRDRAPDENLQLLRRMRAGEFPDGARVLRAKIDMASANMKMRDPLLYRIRHASHHRTGDQWCIYPMYDYAHPLEDALEGVTHSFCTLEFENNRELYDWVIEHTGVAGAGPAPRQYEFARLALDYTVMSKRKLLQLVQGGHVTGWDDPRMPTLAGMRRRGYSPASIRAFCDLIGVSKANSTVDLGKLEFCVRDELNRTAPRALAVLRPLEVELLGADALAGHPAPAAPFYPDDVRPADDAPALPEARELPLGARLYIEWDDYRDDPPAGYQRLAPGRTVRLRYGPCVTCEEVVRDASGAPRSLRCRVLPETAGGKNPSDGQKVWGVLHWVDAATSVAAEVRLYERLFASAKPEEGGADFLAQLTPGSREILTEARLERQVATCAPGTRWQFERLGYFIADAVDHGATRPVFNRIVALRDGFAARAEARAPEPAAAAAPRAVNAKAKTRPKTRSPQEYRAEARERDPELARAYERSLALGLTPADADLLSGDRATAELFLDAAGRGEPRATARWVINELPRALDGRALEEVALSGANLAELVGLVERGEVTATAGKELLAAAIATGRAPAELAEERGLRGALDEAALDGMIEGVLAAHEDKVAQYRAGKTGLLGFLVGQVVRASGGKAAAPEVSKRLAQRLQG
ncbi:MAG: glutamine--tRNA ligase/YqeY domain fusion protein [Kofleriaceae bacterium]